MIKIFVAIGIIASVVMMVLKRIWSKEAEDKETVEETEFDKPESITSTFDDLHS